MTDLGRLFSVCIPAYNRARYLPELMDSILSQDFQDFEIVICEDLSAEREQIAAIVQRYQSRHPGRLRYFENEHNLGYDGNIRNLVQKASGQFCFFMGNDDILCEGALENVGGLYGMVGRFSAVCGPLVWSLTTYWAVERSGLPPLTGQAIAILTLLLMILLSAWILAPVTDAKRDWAAISRAADSRVG